MPLPRSWALALLTVAGCSKPTTVQPLRVAAASDLARAFEAIGPAFEKKTGIAVAPTFGSSGLLARQIGEGAPFDVFASANAAFVDQLVAGGHGRGDTRAVFARGALVVWSRADGPAPASLAELADPRFRRIAIANPDHAPYGKAALEALGKAGLLPAVEPRLVRGESVQVAFRYVESGNAEVGLVARSLVKGGHSLPVDASLHAPLVQTVIVTQQARDVAAATAFVQFLQSAEGRALLAQNGFDLP